MKKLYLMLILLVAGFCQLNAQDRTISGVITDGGGDPLPGVNVVVKGTTTGTITDIDGNYTIDVEDGQNTLVFSFIGFSTQELTLGSSNIMDVVLGEDSEILDEVVVTALGTERNSRDVVYSNQTVNADDLLSSPNKNTLEALRGKTAGVRITTGSGSVGASSKIVLRAEASLTGNNNALIVVDGIPIENNSTGGGAGEGEGGYADYGNRFNDINPDDIESVTVLKGPSATALYGSRGASGVLLVTTKKGSKGSAKIGFSHTTSVERAYVLLKRQDQYGQGLINPDGSTNIDSGENFSWGAAFDGVVRPWTSPVDTDGDGDLEYLSRPFSAVPNQLENFFRTGMTNVNSLTISGGSEDFSYYTSYANTYQRGILENTDYMRHNFNLSASANLTDRLTSSFGISFAHTDQSTAQEGSRAFEGQNPYANAVQAPVNIPYNELRDYTNPFHSFDGFYGSYTVNPYFVLNEYINDAKINNLLGNLSLNYELMDGVNISTKIGTNIVSTEVEEAVPQYAYSNHQVWEDNLTLTARSGRQSSQGSYARRSLNSRNIDWTTMLNFSKFVDSNGDFKLNASVGYNLFDRKITDNRLETQGGLVVPGVYNLANSVNQARATQDDSQYRIMGVLGNVSLGWKNKLFLEYSARNDWSSTLPAENQSFFYQGIGASAILTEFIDVDENILNFLKLRASFGTTGKDADLHLLNSVFFGNPIAVDYNDIYDINFPLNGQTGFTKGSLIGNPDLKPELTSTLEFGFDAALFNDKVELAYTYYSSNHNDQIVEVSLPRTSGYSRTAKNVGKITNKGHELGLNLKPIYNPNGFSWTMNFTWSKNTNEVVKISDETDELVIWSSGRGVTFVAEEGQPFGTFKGQVQRFDPNGNPIVTSNGTLAYTSDTHAIGNVQPDWLAGLGSTLSYKNLSFSFLFDAKKGSSIFSLTKSATEFNGSAITTLLADRKPFVLENSVVEVTDAEGNISYEANTKETLADAFLFDGNYSRNVLDGSFLKLREISLSYELPRSMISKVGLGAASISLFAKNVKFWLPEENSFGDPEANGPEVSQNNVTNIETTQTPPARSFGVNLNIQF